MRRVQRGVHAVRISVDAHADAHGGAAVQVRRVQRGVHGVGESLEAHAEACICLAELPGLLIASCQLRNGADEFLARK